MVIKKAAKVGEAIDRLMKSEEINGNQLALDLNVSRQHGSHMKNNRRNMPQDIAQSTVNYYDNPEYISDIIYEFSSGFTPPVFRGKNLERHRLAMEKMTIAEMEEAIQTMRSICLAKPPQQLDKKELEDVAKMIDEILDARTFIDNLLIQLQNEYKISLKKRIRESTSRWKARGWMG